MMQKHLIISSLLVLIVSIFELYVYIGIETSTKYKIYRLHFVAVLNVVFWFGSKFIWKRLTQDFSDVVFPKSIALIWKGLLLIYLVLAHTAYLSNYLCSKEATWIGLATWTCFGTYILLFTSLFVLAMCRKILSKLKQNCILTIILKPHYSSFISVFVTLFISIHAFHEARQSPVLFRYVGLINFIYSLWNMDYPLCNLLCVDMLCVT